jgi:MerR family transcriptional regulator/heat shock protein HspR/chaperone modulatory protein CbpM
MSQVALSRIVISPEGDYLYSFEYAALVNQTSVTMVQRFADFGLIEPIGSMLRSHDIARIGQIQRLRRDLGLNLMGAALVLDMAQEITQLRAQLHRYEASCYQKINEEI